MTWFGLSLGSAVSVALSDVFAKGALRTVPVPAVAISDHPLGAHSIWPQWLSMA